jgi:hypothetical protein
MHSFAPGIAKQQLRSECATDAEIDGFSCKSGFRCIELAFDLFVVVIAVIVAIAIVIPIFAF